MYRTRTGSWSLRYFAVAAAFATLFACSSRAMAPQPPLLGRTKQTQAIAVSQNPLLIPAYVVSIFGPYTEGHFVFLDKSFGRIGVAKALVSGQIQMDATGDVYILGFVGAYENEVLKYAPPYSEYNFIAGPNKGAAIGYAVDPKTGDFTVNDVSWNDGKPPPALGFYRGGTRWPCKILWNWLWTLTQGAYDADGVPYMLYWSQNSQATLVSLPGGCKADIRTVKTFTPTLTGPVFFNAKNQLVEASTSLNAAGPIITYPHPKTGKIGKALFQTILGPIGGKTPFMLSFNSDGSEIVASYGNQLGIYKYPAGGTPIKVIHFASNSWVKGAAAYPPLIP